MNALHQQRGLSLTEVMIVIVLASLVMVGLVSFYLNSQATWIDASSQAMAQREATLLLETISTRAHEAASAEVYPSPDDDRCGLAMYRLGETEPAWEFLWQDSTIVLKEAALVRPLVTSRVERFRVTKSDSLVEIEALQLRSANGHTIRYQLTVAMNNSRP